MIFRYIIFGQNELIIYLVEHQIQRRNCEKLLSP